MKELFYISLTGLIARAMYNGHLQLYLQDFYMDKFLVPDGI